MDVCIEDLNYLNMLILPSARPLSVKDIWTFLIERVSSSLDSTSCSVLEHILKKGNLSSRIIKALNSSFNQSNLLKVYRCLNHCLLTNTVFDI